MGVNKSERTQKRPTPPGNGGVVTLGFAQLSGFSILDNTGPYPIYDIDEQIRENERFHKWLSPSDSGDSK